MDRNEEEYDRCYHCFADSFQKVKGKGGPGRRIDRLVVDLVYLPVQFRVVDQAVHPVEIGVVNEEGKQGADGNPPQRIVSCIGIELGIGTERCFENQ